MAIKMAANFVETWKSSADSAVSQEGDEYAKSDAYTNILNILSSSKDRTCVSLRGNSSELKLSRLGNTDLEILVKALSENGEVKELDLSYNRISDSGLEPLCNYLKEMYLGKKWHGNYKELTTDLGLRESIISKYLILSQLVDPVCCIATLNISHNEITAVGAQLLANSLQFNSSVVSLNVSGCKIGRDGGIHIAAMLQVNRSLASLGLSYTDIDTDVIIAMATVLHGNQTLKSIDLSRPLLHSHQEETTIHISKMLQMNFTLKELRLSFHCMTDTGCEWLCRHLKENHSLSLLDISSNKLSRDGGKYLADLLKTNTPLSVLNISCNHINDHGLSYISSALQTNTRLTSLNLCYDGAGNEGLCELARCLLHYNSTLIHLYIWGNTIGTPTANAFQELMEIGRLEKMNTDVEYYIVDGVTHLSRTCHNAY